MRENGAQSSSRLCRVMHQYVLRTLLVGCVCLTRTPDMETHLRNGIKGEGQERTKGEIVPGPNLRHRKHSTGGTVRRKGKGN